MDASINSQPIFMKYYIGLLFSIHVATTLSEKTQKYGVDDIGTIYLMVYRIQYILRSVHTKFCKKYTNYILSNSAFFKVCQRGIGYVGL